MLIEQSTYCSLSTSAWDDRNKKICCWAKLPEYKNYQEMHNDNTVKQLVDDLQNGIRNPICKTCWAMEDDGIFSMRQQSLQNEGLPKTNDFLQQELQDKKLKYLMLNSGTQCNFACRTCGPWNSTGHCNEWAEKNGRAWKTDNVDLEGLLKQDLSNVKNIEVLGGEPFTNLDHLKVINKLKNSQPYWLTYTTNGSVRIRKEILDKFTNFKAVNICLSIDAIGKPFEYIRTLGKWDQIVKNVANLQEQMKTYKHLSINAHITISALNVLYINESIDWLDSKNIPFDFTYCYHPNEYSMNLFNEKQKRHIINYLKDKKETAPIIKHIENSKFDEGLFEKFKYVVSFTEKFRKLSLKDYLPKLHELVI